MRLAMLAQAFAAMGGRNGPMASMGMTAAVLNRQMNDVIALAAAMHRRRGYSIGPGGNIRSSGKRQKMRRKIARQFHRHA